MQLRLRITAPHFADAAMTHLAASLWTQCAVHACTAAAAAGHTVEERPPFHSSFQEPDLAPPRPCGLFLNVTAMSDRVGDVAAAQVAALGTLVSALADAAAGRLQAAADSDAAAAAAVDAALADAAAGWPQAAADSDFDACLPPVAAAVDAARAEAAADNDVVAGRPDAAAVDAARADAVAAVPADGADTAGAGVAEWLQAQPREWLQGPAGAAAWYQDTAAQLHALRDGTLGEVRVFSSSKHVCTLRDGTLGEVRVSTSTSDQVWIGVL